LYQLMVIHIKVVCTKMSKTCIPEVNSTRIGIGIKLLADIVYHVRSSLPHARLQTCITITVTKNTQIHESTQGYIRGVYTNSGSPAL